MHKVGVESPPLLMGGMETTAMRHTLVEKRPSRKVATCATMRGVLKAWSNRADIACGLALVFKPGPYSRKWSP